MYLDRKFGLNLSLSEITLLFNLSLYLDRTLAQRKAKSKVKVTQCPAQHMVILETIIQVNLSTGAKHPAFSTNHLVDIDKTNLSSIINFNFKLISNDMKYIWPEGRGFLQHRQWFFPNGSCQRTERVLQGVKTQLSDTLQKPRQITEVHDWHANSLNCVT